MKCVFKHQHLQMFGPKLTPVLLDPDIIRFQQSFNPNKMPLKMIKYSVVDAQLIKYFNLGDVDFS